MKGAYVMNTRQLHYLLTIAERGSLSQAAMALGISQPALSKVLTEWDSLCASPLFLRYHRRQIPTALGRKVLEYAEKIVDEQNRMMLTMRSVTGREKQNIRVCTAPNRGAIIYSKIYNRFSRRYPDISLRLTELYAREQPHAIRRGQVDLALGAGTDSELVTDIPIVREELLVSLPSSHPLAGQKSIRLRDLRDTPFVLQGKRHSIRAIADGLFAEAGFAPVVSFESDDVILLDSMMHQAVGAGLVSKAHVFPCDELAVMIGYAQSIFQMTLDIARAPYTALMEVTMSAEDFTFAGIEEALKNGLVTIVATTSIVGTLLLVILEIALGWNYFSLLRIL